ncbi:MAG: YitT family protein, partial [Candidatus Riflebacteria bacterium]|nr:YitT family protein [Candidatus Riflebacteria bacterium]
IPIGLTILIGNVFLVAMQVKMVGKKTAWKTIYVTVVSSIATDLMMGAYHFAEFSPYLAFLDSIESHFVVHPLTTDLFLAVLYGGIASGVAMGLIFKTGGTTGGTDIITQIIHFSYKLPIAHVSMCLNAAVLIACAYFKGMHLAMYSLIYVYISSKVIDIVLEGISNFRTVFVFTSEPDVIGWAIIEDLRRGATTLEGIGIYSGKKINILMTAIKRGELPLLRTIVYEFDPKAFIIVSDARQVLGQGFAKLEDEIRFDTSEVEQRKQAQAEAKNAALPAE